MEPEKQIEIYEPVKSLVTAEQAKEGWQRFLALKEALMSNEDYAVIQGKRWLCRSGHRKLDVAFGLSDRIVEQERVEREDGSFYWRIVVETQAPNGRISTGVGICDSKERSFAHVEHDVYATAHTRAKNRATSDMVAGGAVSAEEMETAPTSPSKPQEIAIIDQEAVLNALEREGLDTTSLDVYPDGGVLVVAPHGYLGDIWGRYNDCLRGNFGAKWVTMGKSSRWEIRP